MRRRFLPANTQLRSRWRVSLVYWLSLAGIGVWTAAAATGHVPGTPTIRLGPFLIVLFLGAANLAFRSWERVRREQFPDCVRHNLFGWLFVTVDLVLITEG